MATPLPPLNGLRAFEAAARHLSFTRAAAELHVTQTAISHQIRRLEAQLGMRLFLRGPAGLTLTPEGQQYLPAVREAFEGLRRATARLREPRQARITVSTLPSLAAKWLVPRLARFQAAHPGIEIRLTTSVGLVDFRRDEVDLAVRYGHGRWPDLAAEWLMSESIFPVCSPALLAGEPPLRRPEDLAGHTILHVGNYPEDWTMWFTAAGLPELRGIRSLTFDITMMALQAASDGLGVALGRTPLVDADLAAGRLVRPFALSLAASAGYYVVAPRDSVERPAIQAVWRWLLAEARGTDAAALNATSLDAGA